MTKALRAENERLRSELDAVRLDAYHRRELSEITERILKREVERLGTVEREARLLLWALGEGSGNAKTVALEKALRGPLTEPKEEDDAITRPRDYR